MTPRYKFGTLAPDGSDVEFHYDDRYEREHTSSSDRLIIAPAREHAALLGELAGLVPEPYSLLYVLVVSRTGRAEGRYESGELLTLAEVRHFLKEHARFLERDGRHALWISAPAGMLLVYDRHDVIYAYGPIDDMRRLLDARGFRKARVSFPSPHSHYYNAEGDLEEDHLFASMEWHYSPLKDGDDL